MNSVLPFQLQGLKKSSHSKYFLFWSFQPSSKEFCLFHMYSNLVPALLSSPQTTFKPHVGHWLPSVSFSTHFSLSYPETPSGWTGSHLYKTSWNFLCSIGLSLGNHHSQQETVSHHVCACCVSSLDHAWCFQFVLPLGQDLSSLFFHSIWPSVNSQVNLTLNEQWML